MKITARELRAAASIARQIQIDLGGINLLKNDVEYTDPDFDVTVAIPVALVVEAVNKRIESNKARLASMGFEYAEDAPS
jgi:hypothetical protein